MADKEILGGKNVVMEILRAKRRKVYRVFWGRRLKDQTYQEIQNLIGDQEVKFREVSLPSIATMTGSEENQGMAIEVSPFEYTELGDVVAAVQKKRGFLVLLDEIQDPHNVGAIIRTAHALGAGGLILLKNRQSLVTNAVCKAAAGAQEYLPIVKETNLVNTIKYLKDNDFSIYGAEKAKENSIYNEKLSFPLGLVLGGEQDGLRRLVRENCDRLVSIPMQGKIDSLNVSVAAGILMGEISRKLSINA
ncbi:MAG: 23S rRNA (guanosine(2251)-2'-O)-methyltransferase RlmB [Deltaproteobacteria bacterium]|nr:23S rRNA (guanosine(2251)-2'-O)-methyltransferase RlmB [Deltaproteobacteria bacterium]